MTLHFGIRYLSAQLVVLGTSSSKPRSLLHYMQYTSRVEETYMQLFGGFLGIFDTLLAFCSLRCGLHTKSAQLHLLQAAVLVLVTYFRLFCTLAPKSALYGQS